MRGHLARLSPSKTRLPLGSGAERADRPAYPADASVAQHNHPEAHTTERPDLLPDFPDRVGQERASLWSLARISQTLGVPICELVESL